MFKTLHKTVHNPKVVCVLHRLCGLGAQIVWCTGGGSGRGGGGHFSAKALHFFVTLGEGVKPSVTLRYMRGEGVKNPNVTRYIIYGRPLNCYF